MLPEQGGLNCGVGSPRNCFGGYGWLWVVTWVTRVREVTVSYWRLQVATCGYVWIWVVMGGYGWLQVVTSGYGGYRGLRGLWVGGGPWHQDLLIYWIQWSIDRDDLTTSDELKRSKKGGMGKGGAMLSRSFGLLNSMIYWSGWSVDSKWRIDRCYIHP